MPEYQRFLYPNVPPDFSENVICEDKQMIIVGVIGKSSFPDCNKMAGLKVLNTHPSLIDHEANEGQITFYYNNSESMLFVHFETSYDNYCMEKLFHKHMEVDKDSNFMLFNSYIRNRFARMLLFATQICHIVVFVETNVAFDSSYLGLFKSLKIIREQYVLGFLPKFVKNSNACSFLGKDGRLCSPRFIFFFENYPEGYDTDKKSIEKLEFAVEDNIYKMFRDEFIITNNSSMSLFSIPGNKRFVFYNTDKLIREDPLLKSINFLNKLIEKSITKEDPIDDLDDLRPYKGFGKPLSHYSKSTITPIDDSPHDFMTMLQVHVEEALLTGFDDSIAKYKGKSHFVIPNMKSWFDTFKILHKLFIENPNNLNFEANDPDYKSYLENFNRVLDIDEEFFQKCCEVGFNKAIALYNNSVLTHYGRDFHKNLVEESIALLLKYARGPHIAMHEKKLRDRCEQIWQNGRQKCEIPSLRGNPCIRPNHVPADPSDHSSGLIFVSSCNCGRIQGRREDPYTIRHANYEFYEVLADNCSSCTKVEKVHFAVFEPSINNFRPAELETSLEMLSLNQKSDRYEQTSDCSQPLTASLRSHTNLSLESMNDLNKINCESSDDESVNELVIHVGDNPEENERNILRQPSTTEYLPGMVHTESPVGVLPQFPSWSLLCVGPSSVYSHNSGLTEHYQSGFLSGTNFLLPWDVHVRLEHSASWAAAYEKSRYRKKGEVFVLKIFVGCEYECPWGHRFIMSSPDKVLRGGSGIIRDSGSKVVFNDMPLYFPCPCRASKPLVAQLMRVHIVTPKAPVNVILEPKVRTGDRNYIFTIGLPNPPKLSQSSYWILRFPYSYQGDDGPILPPQEVSASNAMSYGCLMAGMYGVTETEGEN